MGTQLTIDQQMVMIRRGTVQILPEDELRAKLEKSRKSGVPLKIKLGLDPTAPDIHLGIAVVLRKMRQFQDLGHEVIIIIGDFTASIGDPSGVSVTRPLLTPEEIAANARTYKEQYCKILDESKTRVVYNSEWLRELDFAGVVRIAAKMTVARVLERDDFTARLADGRPIGLHELLYPMSQAYDSVVLEADVEVGATDQTFNILTGRDLQREFGQEPQVALFMPILVGLDGEKKMSKSLGNYVGVAEPPKDMFGKLMSIPDHLMRQYFELCTDLKSEEIEEILSRHPMEAKELLAQIIVAMYHRPPGRPYRRGAAEPRQGRTYIEELVVEAPAAVEVKEEFERVFSKREMPADMPVIEVPKSAFKDGKVWIVRLLTIAGFALTNSEARRLAEQGAVTLDGERITDVNAEIALKDGQILHVGKLKYGRVALL